MEHQENRDTTLRLLGEFGLTPQESAVYIALLAEGALNGYEVSKKLGISRSNAYTSLAALTDKGAALIIEGTPTRYSAAEPKAFFSFRFRALEEARSRLLAILPTRRETDGAYMTIRGRDQILDKLKQLVECAAERVYLAVPGAILETLEYELTALAGAGKKIVVITDAAGIAFVRKDAIFAGINPYGGIVRDGQIRAIADSRYVLTGAIDGPSPSCLFSDQTNLVELFKEALSNEIKLIDLGAIDGRV
jgi:HTH-type transcriptional regulator, sugar sensing transcriptional regulator